MRVPPNEVRYFLHKRLARAARGFVTSGFNPLAAVSGFVAPTPRRAPLPLSIRPPGLRASNRAFIAEAQALPVRRPVARSLTARPGAASASEKEAGRRAKAMGGGATRFRSIFGINFPSNITTRDDDCLPFFKRNAQGMCVPALGEQVGRDDTPIGDTVMGRYGAGEQPGNMVVNRAICRPGMVLGNDGVCYNRSQISNKEREWPRGRRPLLTGGDMKAISTAARAGKRLEGATKRLQKIGLMKKPAPKARRVTSGPTEHHHHE